MENTPFSSHLWMSRYGLLHRNGSSFLGARPLRILQPDASIPTQLPGDHLRAYRASESSEQEQMKPHDREFPRGRVGARGRRAAPGGLCVAPKKRRACERRV